MKYNECRICGSHVDAGELVNGICLDCLEEKEKEKDIQYRMQKMVMSREYKQMDMEEFLK
ncbi:hypothetical protein I6E50_02005 [Roseburia hominis]|uniref:hypothetical protein n=1 Tax=Roseburia hominis TaxID=301301 RepID=UPI001F1C984E|nr:hypothetical protein [Roseburia hominis]